MIIDMLASIVIIGILLGILFVVWAGYLAERRDAANRDKRSHG